tara:strand:+ start:2295 stop:2531 length:237 start_codon:yes stop_codon:yes gene_type:complete
MINAGMMSQMPTGRLEETINLAKNRFDARINGTPMERALEAAMPNNAITLGQQQTIADVTGGFTADLAADPNLYKRAL